MFGIGFWTQICLLPRVLDFWLWKGALICPVLKVFSIDVFKLWCCRRLLKVPWTARRSNQSILQEINPEYSLEGLMLKLKLQYFGHLMWRANTLEKTLMLGKTEGRKKKGVTEDEMVGWHHRLKWHEFEWTLRNSGRRSLVCFSPWGCKESDTT